MQTSEPVCCAELALAARPQRCVVWPFDPGVAGQTSGLAAGAGPTSAGRKVEGHAVAAADMLQATRLQ